MVNYKIRNKNIKDLVESDFYKDMYTKMEDYHETEFMENKSAFIFNTILLTAQLIENPEQIKRVVENFLKENYRAKKYLIDIFFAKLVLEIEKECDIKLDKKSISESLCHGCAVHFTTLNLAKEIEKEKILRCSNSFLKKEEENQIIKIIELQRSKLSKDDVSKYFSLGCQYARGISMGSQTEGFWMNNTPESMCFLFGTDLQSSGYDEFKEHVKKCTDQLEEEDRKNATNLLESLWNRVVGKVDGRGCILINRDDLEYEVDTDWSEDPPRKVEKRPYSNNRLDELFSLENSRYSQDIIVREDAVINVPTIQELEKYKNENLDIVNSFSSKQDYVSIKQTFDKTDELFK